MRVFILTYEDSDGITTVLGVYDSLDKIQNAVGTALALVPSMNFSDWVSVGAENLMSSDVTGNAYVIAPMEVIT